MILRFAPLVCAALLAVVGAGAASARPSSTVHTVKVTAKDYEFVLSTNKVPAGRVKFVVKDMARRSTTSRSRATRRGLSVGASRRRCPSR